MKTEVLYRVDDDDLEKVGSLTIDSGMIKCRFGTHNLNSAHVPIAHVSESFFDGDLNPLNEKEIRTIAMSG